MSITIETIGRHHDRKTFDCGVTELNRFLHQQARQKAAKNIARTYVACEGSAPDVVVGYHTLTGYSVTVLPEHRDYKNYPHPLSAVKLARLAVDRSHQGKRLGEKLLVDAIYRTTLVAQQIATIGLFVDPMMPEVVPFYQQYGFLSADPGNADRIEMWLPVGTCSEVVGVF
jgi:GNAT superfamily N-acetyltransferase